MDMVVTMGGGVAAIKNRLAKYCPEMDPDDLTFIEGAGHWIQQEKAALVNSKLFSFANKHKARFTRSAPSKL